MRVEGFAPPCMIVAASCRSMADSASVTNAGESSSPHGVWLPKAWRYHSLNSVSPAFFSKWPSGP